MMDYYAIYKTPSRNGRTKKASIGDPLATVLVSEFFISITFLLLLFENALQSKIWAPFAYLDEIVCLLFLAFAVLSTITQGAKVKISNNERRMIYISIVIGLIGIIGNFLYHYQIFHAAIAVDFITCNKFIIAYISTTIVLSNSNYKSIYRICILFAKLYVAIAFIFMVVNQIFDIGMTCVIGMSPERRFGIAAFLFIFGHPSNFAASIVGILALFLVDCRNNFPSILMSLILLVSTTRFKAIAFVLVIMLAIVLFRNRSKLTFGFIIMAVIVSLAATLYQLDIYLSSETARLSLLQGSLEIANNLFPFGSGFGTYGSEVTKEAYTSIYSILGFQHVYGLTPNNPIYLSDMFYPTVIAQFGWIGLICFLLLLFFLITDVAQISKRNKVFFWAAMSIPIYLIIASTAEPSFYSSYSVYLAFCLVLLLNNALNRYNTTKPI